MAWWFILVLVAAGAVASGRRIVVHEWERGLLFVNGRILTELATGAHWVWQPFRSIRVVDTRPASFTISGQEVLTADHVAVKLSLVVTSAVTDARRSVEASADVHGELYLAAQLALRDAVAEIELEALLGRVRSLGDDLLEPVAARARALGVTVSVVAVKDLMLPGPLKKAFGDVVAARRQGLATLERARAETATLRKLANAAKLVRADPEILQLRALQAAEGGTVVFGAPSVVPSPPPRES